MNHRFSRTIASGAIVGVVLACGISAALQAGGTVQFPDGYRHWTHIKSTIVGPESAVFATEGGIHHYYANPQAMEGLETGTFPDGSILIDDLLETRDVGKGITSEGAHRRVAVMYRDAQNYRDTGGWRFELYKGNSRSDALTSEVRATCYACHQKASNSVFSKFRE